MVRHEIKVFAHQIRTPNMTSYTRIGDTVIQPRHRATCHCGRVVLELELPNGVEDPRRCNCSLCSRRAAVMASVPEARLHVVQGEEFIALYEFNTKVAKHYFCKVCGIYTHHRKRSDPSVFGFNVACLEGVDIFALSEIPVSDGRNHVCDRQRDSSV